MNTRLLRRRSGFTLIELLIVIVIIGVLATLGLVGYSNALINSRNARRIADLNSTQASFEQYYTTNGGSYNATCSNMATSLQGGALLKDPSTNTTYDSSCSTTAYCVCASLEPASGASPPRVKGANATGRTNQTCNYSTSTGNYYCISNKQ